ncbi:hypothetical protein PR048_012857 [Dryococelus australis]|uniref:Uncharacterized protein n=1 Tax=Dryococelus australis TaxID=614101 RepID=A0ABQ9HR69_9NEOP|nr:hypothetical protein PR048_012857 [Dryococelus australis]
MDISEEEGQKYDRVVKCLECIFSHAQTRARNSINLTTMCRKMVKVLIHLQQHSDASVQIVVMSRYVMTSLKTELCPTLTLAKAVQICKVVEQTHELMQVIDRNEAVGPHVEHRSNRTEENVSGTLAGDREGYDYGTSHCRTGGNHKGRMVHNTNQAHSKKWGLSEQAVHHQQQKQKTPWEYNSKKDSYTRLKHVFQGLGDIKIQPHQFVLKPDSKPSVVTFQRIPFLLHDQLKEEPDRMIELEVIAKVTEPTEWLNPIEGVRKPTEEL